VAEGGVVAVTENGTYVAVIGNELISLDDLVATAESFEEFKDEPSPSPSATPAR
jgi:hypothetical protein